MSISLIPDRTVEEIISGQIPVTLGRTRYVLPELAMDQTDAWAGSIDDRLRELFALLDTIEDSSLMSLFNAAITLKEELFDALIAYDKTAVLPDRAELRKVATHTEVMLAVAGVWLSTRSPLVALVATLLKSLPAIEIGSAPKPISGSAKRSGGRRPKSEAA